MNSIFSSGLDFWFSASKSVLNLVPDSVIREKALGLLDLQAQVSKQAFDILFDAGKAQGRAK